MPIAVPAIVKSVRRALCPLSLCALLACGGVAEEPVETTAPELGRAERKTERQAAASFDRWLERVRETRGEAADLYYAYYDTAESKPWFLSTMISAEVLRYELRRGHVEKARRIGDALLRWQHDGSGTNGDRIQGAFPSEIEHTAQGFRARYLYDSSDSMAVMEGLMDLYEATSSDAYLNAARMTGVWLRDVMARGDRYGVWLAPLGAPMKAVTNVGDFDNRIAVGRTLFWLPVLDRLSRLTGDPSFAALAADARALLSLGQLDSGGYADNYDPRWPAEAFSLSNFEAYGADGSVVADDSIRAGLAALHAGNRDAAQRFAGWLVSEQGRIPGYLALDSGAAHFPQGNAKYYDVFSSALYRKLGAALELADAADAARFVSGSQATDGGWFWGWDAARQAPVDANQSTLTGAWAIVDLSPRG